MHLSTIWASERAMLLAISGNMGGFFFAIVYYAIRAAGVHHGLKSPFQS